MRDTKPQRATASEQAYRDATGTPTRTAPALKELAEAALAVLAKRGSRDAGGVVVTTTSASGVRFDIRCSGPDLPATIPGETIHPSMIPKRRPWVGAYRLMVKAPLLVFELYWNEHEPLRIMQFSRGDWEHDLRAQAE
jgi:hypothetical protein